MTYCFGFLTMFCEPFFPPAVVRKYLWTPARVVIDWNEIYSITKISRTRRMSVLYLQKHALSLDQHIGREVAFTPALLADHCRYLISCYFFAATNSFFSGFSIPSKARLISYLILFHQKKSVHALFWLLSPPLIDFSINQKQISDNSLFPMGKLWVSVGVSYNILTSHMSYCERRHATITQQVGPLVTSDGHNSFVWWWNVIEFGKHGYITLSNQESFVFLYYLYSQDNS